MDVTDLDLKLATLNEGLRLQPYRDTVGKLTVGIGRNLDDVGISRAEAEFLCKNDLSHAREALVQMDPWALKLDAVRLAALTDLVFNMGAAGWRKFIVTRGWAQVGDWEATAAALEKSKWFTQVGLRGPRVCQMIRAGQWPWEP